MFTSRTPAAARFWLIVLLLAIGSAHHTAAPLQAQPPDPFAAASELPSPSAILRTTPGTLDRLHAPLLRTDLELLGAPSCAAASCHGGPRPGVAQPHVSRGSEYQLWLENDPHARSWRTISSQPSVQMMRKLKIMRGDTIVDQAGFDNCLACHNTTKRFDEPRSHVQRQEGVGCAGCHGPEQLWQGPHDQWGFDPLESTAIGFVANGDLLTRARACAACHVGDQDRDMNHDLIAAGHPPLRYEFATYHAWQPKHWRDQEAGDRTYYEAQLWLTGQVAAADAFLSLLQARSARQHSASRWPELASYDCSSCHHSLALSNARRTPAEGSAMAVAPLSNWNFAGLQWLIEDRIQRGVAIDDDARVLGTLARVREEMQSGPQPDPSRTHAAVLEARQAIDSWARGPAGAIQRSRFRSEHLGRLAAQVAGQTETYDTWESAAQLYLALVAARESWPGGWTGPLYPLAEQLRRGLRYPELASGPRFATSQPTAATATRSQVRQMTLAIASQLGPVMLDRIPLPAADEPSPQQLRSELESSFQEATQRWQKRQQLQPPAKAEQIPAADPQRDQPDTLPPRRDPAAQPPQPPAVPRITPEELRRRLQELERN